jgi:hypothetical protein
MYEYGLSNKKKKLTGRRIQTINRLLYRYYNVYLRFFCKFTYFENQLSILYTNC